MKFWSVWLLLMTDVYMEVMANEECVPSDLCDCIKLEEFQYRCPPDPYKITLNTIPEKYARIQCHKLNDWNLNLLPNVTLGDLDNFTMLSCPLPNNFINILKTINVRTVKKRILKNILNNKYDIKKKVFYGLSELENLDLKLPINELQEDFFENLPNLQTLDLEATQISKIAQKTFKYIPKLKKLYLSWNNIFDITGGLFEDLSELQILALWLNKITVLNKSCFTGLKHLNSLDLWGNKIAFLEDDTFAELTELTQINLNLNDLHDISYNIFRYNTALKLIRLGDNPNINLSDYVFANLSNLLEVNIDNSNLKTLPKHIFQGCSNLTQISLENNNIRELPEIVFEGLSNLKVLNLKENKLKILSNNIFLSLKKLENLDLQANQLEEIKSKMFGRNSNLKTLNLSFNKIAYIDRELSPKPFIHHRREETIIPFANCTLLNLSHNVIKTFPTNIITSRNDLTLDLSYNRISQISMASLFNKSIDIAVTINNNYISVLDFEELKQFENSSNSGKTVKLDLSNNPITCNCSNFDLIRYYNNESNPALKSVIDIRVGHIDCAMPESFRKTSLTKLKLHEVTCPIMDRGCPNECKCAYRPYDDHAVVYCSNRNLTSAPSILLGYNKIEVQLDRNFIEHAPSKGLGYQDVTKLYLSNNRIRGISWVPPKIEVLTLNGNQIEFIDSKILDALNRSTTLKNLTLYGNPWRCDCSATALQNFLKTHNTTIGVVCSDNMPIDLKELCKSQLNTIMGVSIFILIILLTLIFLLTLYFYYKAQIKMWLYEKNLCSWWVTEEDLDKDKTYDIFISYSQKDEDFVVKNLQPVLEGGSNPFKVCNHSRDFIPGELIAKQITDSVLNSRRTLVILSHNFLESIWGRMEFRIAHTQAISEGRARVIVVKYGNLNEKNLDNELKAYLKTNTYLDWADRWFWTKLNYSLPHSKKKRYDNKSKHANIRLKIDNNFEMVSPLDSSIRQSQPFNASGVVTSSTTPLMNSESSSL